MVSPTLVKCESGKSYEPIYMTTVIDGDKKNPSKWLECLQKSLKCLFYMLLVLTIVFSIQLVIEHFCNYQENYDRLDRYEKMFNDFMVKYNRNYETPEELEYRFRIFIKNVEEYEEEERRYPGLDLDVNQFTDWTDFELKRMTPHEKIRSDNGETSRVYTHLYGKGESRPASFDWRDQGKLTPVKNQASCGSCWAFATVAAVEAQHAIKRGNLVSLSEQEMVDCDQQNNGCHGGYRPYAMDFVKRKGLETEKEYPYKGLEGQQCLLETNLTRVFIDDYEQLGQDEEYIADWVSKNGPVTFGMNVVKSMYSYRSGIYNPSEEDCEEKSMGSHALTIVGYGVEGSQPFWIVKNSWGSSWGASGYFRLARGVNSCGAAKTVVAPIIR
ncbi:unnamed protein product [Caenorhabditis angaria]|uniref:Uncharacterized protein n=1 Tax=Caenorhabditis angaria TaxID=860376 RepID=A0A9P1J2Y0_9PELO|nr:unnamed protein product [Caenorhabditis angaria]